MTMEQQLGRAEIRHLLVQEFNDCDAAEAYVVGLPNIDKHLQQARGYAGAQGTA